MIDELLFDKAALSDLKREYEDAIAKEIDVFSFRGQALATHYAGYLLKALQAEFDKGKDKVRPAATIRIELLLDPSDKGLLVTVQTGFIGDYMPRYVGEYSGDLDGCINAAISVQEDAQRAAGLLGMELQTNLRCNPKIKDTPAAIQFFHRVASQSEKTEGTVLAGAEYFGRLQ